MKLQEFRDEQPRTGHLTFWDGLETPGILSLKDAGLLAVLRYEGPDLYSAPTSALLTQAQRLNAIYKRFGKGWGVLTECRNTPVVTYPEAAWPDPVTRMVDAKRRAFFTAPGHFWPVTYLVLVYRPQGQVLPGWKHWVYANLPDAA